MANKTTRKKEEKDFNLPMAVFVFVAVTVIVIIFSLTQNDPSFEFSNQVAIENGIQAPDFKFPGIDGKMIRLADQIDQLPEGAGAVTFLLVIILVMFLVLVIFDLTGVTDVFPFIKSQR